jgi:transcriptional regulator with XRE-family HTH domain
MNEKKTFQELFREIIEMRGFNLERLAEATNIPKDYLAALASGEFNKLPSSPYIRGYLIKISNTLGIDTDYLWSVYKKEVIPSLKKGDHLPINRFAPPKNNKKGLLMAIVLFFAIIYLAFRIDDIIGVPEIEISRPANNNEITNEQFINLSGKINDFFDKLTINGEEVPTEESGKFEKEYQLRPGVNKIEFKVKRFLGKEIKIEREIIYQLQQ